MNKVIELFRLLIDSLTEALERAEMQDHDAYVGQATNEREASQRIHRLETAGAGL
jgi:hypothetical protein